MKKPTVFIAAAAVLAVLAVLFVFSPPLSLTPVKIKYPYDRSVFPPEIAPAEFVWSDLGSGAERWTVRFEFGDGGPELTARADSSVWRPQRDLWEEVKKRTVVKPAVVVISGSHGSLPGRLLSRFKPLSEGRVTISTSPDSVGAPIFFRDVPLPFNFAKERMELIQWRLGDISRNERPPIVLDNLPVCGNCHTFARDGKTIAMDVDSGGDKGAYVISPIEEQIFYTREKLITWNDYRRAQGAISFGLLAQISPDGRFVAATVQDRVIFLGKEGSKIEFSQLFFPVKGIVAYYDRAKKDILPLPGADDLKVVQSNPSWSPDGKYIIFARAHLHEFVKNDKSTNIVLTLAQSAVFLGGEQYLADATTAPPYTFSLYRIPFNGGKGGKPEPVPGASENGVSNYFARYSPDGRWIVFCKARSFMLLQPDSRLWIMPADFSSQPRELVYQTGRMNSWHSWSPNSKWLVFSSKEYSPYTELFLTHIDENGNNTPPVRLAAFSAPDRARNIPEFANIPQQGIKRIHESFVDYYSYIRKAEIQEEFKKFKEAEDAYRESIKMNPNFAESRRKLAYLLLRDNRSEEAQKEFEAALRLEPKDPLGHQNLGEIYLGKKDYDKARAEFDACLKMNPRYSPAYLGIGLILLEKGDKPRAKASIETAVKLDSYNVDAQYILSEMYVEEQKFEKAESAIIVALQSSKYDIDPDAINRLGTINLYLKKYDVAEKAFMRTVALDPDNSQAIHNLGIIYLHKNDLERAEQMFRKVYQLNSENPGVILMLAQVLAQNEKTVSEAISLYQKAITLAPGNMQAYVDLGNTFLKMQDKANALREFEKALELNPSSKELRSVVESLKRAK